MFRKSSMILMVQWLALIYTMVTSVRSACPCSDPALCNPVTYSGKEIFIFSLRHEESVWKRYDWTKITTVAMVEYISSDVMCYAHQHNARAVILVDFHMSDLLNPATRHTWIQKQLKIVQDNHLDGINIDFEGGIPETRTDLKNALTSLLNETFAAFKHALPHSQVTIDVPYGPNCVYHRCYDFKALANLVDFFFVMDYDEQKGTYAGANSDYHLTRNGMHDYLAIVPKDKLLLGVPWYGYRYLCSKVTQDAKCTMSQAHGAVKSLTFRQIHELQKHTGSRRMWDRNARAPYFTYTDKSSGQRYQVWYDDAQSLAMKYMVAGQLQLRGVGVWYADCVDYSDTTEANRLREAMWKPLPPGPSQGSIIG